MSSIDIVKKKIEEHVETNAIPSFTDQDIKVILDGGKLTGDFTPSDIFGDEGLEIYVNFLSLGLIGFADEQLQTDTYAGLFDAQLKQQLQSGGFQNLSYIQFQYAIRLFDSGSLLFKEVIKNLSNNVLGPAFSDFTFQKFDAKVSTEINTSLKSGGSVQLNNLPTVTWAAGTGKVTAKDSATDIGKTSEKQIDATFWTEIVDAYNAANGSNPTSVSSTVAYDSDIQLGGNASTIANEFYLSEIEEGGIGFLATIIDFATGVSYKSPKGIVESTYKAFLLAVAEDDSRVGDLYTKYSAAARDDIIKYLVFDFEYTRRMAIPSSIDDPQNTTAEDIIDDAEAAAIQGLADSGMAGEGGVGDKSPIDPEKIEKFYEQCVLMASMKKLKDKLLDQIKEDGDIDSSEGAEASNSIHQPAPYEERFYMVQVPSGQNDRLINFLNAPSDNTINDFLNITPEIQAFLTPKIRLYKVFNEGNNLKQVEFVFRNSTDSTNILNQLFRDNDKFFRGSGYGIKDFSFSFNGTTPATAKNDITADLTLFFQDFSDFITPVQTSQGTFSFIELIFYDKKNENNPTYGYGASHPDQYSPAYYRIRADVGWRVPDNNPQFDDACRKRNLDPDNIRDVIEKTNKSYYLNMVEHDLNFKKDGTIEIKAQYRGYIESVLKGTEMDALVNEEIMAERKIRQNQLEDALKKCTPGEVAQIKRIYSAQEQLLREKLYQSTYKRLSELKKIRTIQVDDDAGFRNDGYFQYEPKLVDLGPRPVGPITEDQFQYYFLGDLLYVMMDALYSESNKGAPIGKTKFILPTIDFESFFDNSGAFSINIAQIPISHRYFTEWWSNNVIKAKRQSYPIMLYLRDILNNLVADALIDTCLNKDYRKSFNFQTTTVNASDDPLANISNSTNPIINLDQNTLPFSVDQSGDINNITNYILVYAAFSTTLPKGTGKYVEDLEKGVYHFHLGQDRGIINDIKFSKVDMQYIREARYLRDGIDGLLQLGAVYRVSMNMFGNTLFYPGMLIYINPFGIGGEEFLPSNPNTIANKLGLGGYHQIEKVNSSITSGLFKTQIDAMFVYSGDGDTRFNRQGKQEEKPDADVSVPEPTGATCPDLVESVRADYLQLLEELPLAPAENLEEEVLTTSSYSSMVANEVIEPVLINSGPDEYGTTSTSSINAVSLGTIAAPNGDGTFDFVEYYRVDNTSDNRIQYFDIDDIFIVEY